MNDFWPVWPSRATVRIPTSVTRWLLVVVGCTGLELVQPAFASDPVAEEDPAVARTGETILYPKNDAADGAARLGNGDSAAMPDTGWVVVGFILLATGGWIWWQRRRLIGRPGGRAVIGIEETKSLGNRQFLVVASCDGRRLLLGVSPGRISTLAELEEADDQSAIAPAVVPSRLEPISLDPR